LQAEADSRGAVKGDSDGVKGVLAFVAACCLFATTPSAPRTVLSPRRRLLHDRALDGHTALPYMTSVHAVLETPIFLRDVAQSGMSEEEHDRIVRRIAEEPMRGDLIPGTGGARKVRLAGRGKGKSGGYRVVSYFAADDVPVLLLALIDKGERADLSQAERNELRKELQGFADDYRAGVKARIADLRKGRRR